MELKCPNQKVQTNPYLMQQISTNLCYERIALYIDFQLCISVSPSHRSKEEFKKTNKLSHSDLEKHNDFNYACDCTQTISNIFKNSYPPNNCWA